MIWCSYLKELHENRLDLLGSATSPKPPRGTPTTSQVGRLGRFGFSGNFPVKNSQVTTLEFDHIHNSSHLRRWEVNDGICAWSKPLHARIPKIMAVCGTCISPASKFGVIFGVSNWKHQFVKNFRSPSNGVLTQPFFLENSFRWNFPTTEIWQPTTHLSPRSSQHPHTHDVSLGWSWQ